MSAGSLELLCFQVGERLFALDIMVIGEILRNQTVTPVPGAPGHVLGVVNLRGELLPAVDLGRMLGCSPGQPGGDRETKLVVVRAGGRSAGLLVDAVLEVVRVPCGELKPVPGATAAGETAAVAAFQRGAEGDGAPQVVVLLRLTPLLDAVGDPVAGAP